VHFRASLFHHIISVMATSNQTVPGFMNQNISPSPRLTKVILVLEIYFIRKNVQPSDY